jgi:general secretion pathway protein H
VELLIVITLASMLFAAVVAGSGMLAGNRLRSAAGLVVTGVRLAVTRSNTMGRPVRLVFDLDAQRISMEETSDRMLLVRETKGTMNSRPGEGPSGGADPATEAEKEALKEADGIVKGPRAPRARFSPIPFGSGDKNAKEGRDLGAGVSFREVQTEHDEKPRDKGRAYIYFWPGGGTERAVVQLERKGGSDALSVLVSPLTGRAKIERGKIALEERHTDEDYGVKETPP